jgi:hypothetical protein
MPPNRRDYGFVTVPDFTSFDDSEQVRVSRLDIRESL